MKTILVIPRASQVEIITGRQSFIRPNQAHKKAKAYTRKAKFGKGWE